MSKLDDPDDPGKAVSPYLICGFVVSPYSICVTQFDIEPFDIEQQQQQSSIGGAGGAAPFRRRRRRFAAFSRNCTVEPERQCSEVTGFFEMRPNARRWHGQCFSLRHEPSTEISTFAQVSGRGYRQDFPGPEAAQTLKEGQRNHPRVHR